jgi:hypothetical protein
MRQRSILEAADHLAGEVLRKSFEGLQNAVADAENEHAAARQEAAHNPDGDGQAAADRAIALRDREQLLAAARKAGFLTT